MCLTSKSNCQYMLTPADLSQGAPTIADVTPDMVDTSMIYSKTADNPVDHLHSAICACLPLIFRGAQTDTNHRRRAVASSGSRRRHSGQVAQHQAIDEEYQCRVGQVDGDACSCKNTIGVQFSVEIRLLPCQTGCSARLVITKTKSAQDLW